MIRNASSPNFGVDPKTTAYVLSLSAVKPNINYQKKCLVPKLWCRPIIKWWAGKDSNLRTLT